MSDTVRDYFDEPLRCFLDDAAAATPTPGGGSVSSLVAALGTTMAQMSAAFTLKSKKYAEHHAAVAPIADRLARAGRMFRELVSEDIAAYGLYSEATKLPKEDPNRGEQAGVALTAAIAVPQEIIATVVAVLEEVERLLPLCNPYLLSDLGVAAIVCEAAARAASLNIWVNLRSLGDVEAAGEIRRQVEDQLRHAAAIRDRVETSLGRSI